MTQTPSYSYGLSSPATSIAPSWVPGGNPSYPSITPASLNFGSTPATAAGVPGVAQAASGMAPNAGSSFSGSFPMDMMTGVGQAVGQTGAGGIGDWFQNNLGTFETLSKVLGGVGSLYSGLQANSLAKESLGFQKEAFQSNLANQISSYNLALEDKVRARYSQKGQSDSDASSYISKHKLGD